MSEIDTIDLGHLIDQIARDARTCAVADRPRIAADFRAALDEMARRAISIARANAPVTNRPVGS